MKIESGIERFGKCFHFVKEDYPYLFNNINSSINISLSGNKINSESLVNYKSLNINLIFIIIFGVFVSVPNIMLIIGLIKTNDKKELTISKKLYIYVSCTDLSFGILTNPYFIIINATGWKNCTLQGLGMSFTVISIGLGVSTFVLISIIRNYQIRKPLNEIRKDWIGIYLLSHILVFVCCYGLTTLLVYFNRFPTTFTLLAIYWFFMFFYFLVETLLMVVYNAWTKISLRYNKVMHLKFSDKNTAILRRNKRAVVTLVWISAVYVACILPVSLYYLWLFITLLDIGKNPDKMVSAYDKFPLVHSLLPLCSGLNAIVYILKSNDLRRFYKVTFNIQWKVLCSS
jgi:hypothetical protein